MGRRGRKWPQPPRVSELIGVLTPRPFRMCLFQPPLLEMLVILVSWSMSANNPQVIMLSSIKPLTRLTTAHILVLGNRLKCVACRIVVHEGCSSALNEKFTCRPTFCESVRKYREFTSVPHHWVQRKQLKVRELHIFPITLGKITKPLWSFLHLPGQMQVLQQDIPV